MNNGTLYGFGKRLGWLYTGSIIKSTGKFKPEEDKIDLLLAMTINKKTFYEYLTSLDSFNGLAGQLKLIYTNLTEKEINKIDVRDLNENSIWKRYQSGNGKD